MVNLPQPDEAFEVSITDVSHPSASVLYELMHDACRHLWAEYVFHLPKNAAPDDPLSDTIRASRREAEDVPRDAVEAWKAKRRNFDDRWRVLRDARLERNHTTRAASGEGGDGSHS